MKRYINGVVVLFFLLFNLMSYGVGVFYCKNYFLNVQGMVNDYNEAVIYYDMYSNLYKIKDFIARGCVAEADANLNTFSEGVVKQLAKYARKDLSVAREIIKDEVFLDYLMSFDVGENERLVLESCLK